MARGDFRYRPRYLFWSAIVTAIIFGAVEAWFIDRRPGASMIAGTIIASTVAVALSWRYGQSALFTGEKVVRPYDHPILALYSGLVAMIGSLVLGNSTWFAFTTALIAGVLMAGWLILYRRLTRRNYPPSDSEMTPTITGWR